MSKRVAKTISYEQMYDLIIRNDFKKAFLKRTIDAGYLSRNKTVKTNCITTKPHRGGFRDFIDRYVSLSIVHPYKNDETICCRASRLAAFLFIGDLPPGKRALHLCDIKMCCNPEHIYIGTDHDNVHDVCNRRTNKRRNGILTRWEWESIKYWRERGEHTVSELARHFGVCNQTIYYEPYFSTDGSEVIGDIFIPKILPEPKYITKVKQVIKQGKELLTFRNELDTEMIRKYGVSFGKYCPDLSPIILEHGKKLGVNSLTEIDKRIRLVKSNVHRSNYKYGYTSLIKMIIQGIDIGIPV